MIEMKKDSQVNIKRVGDLLRERLITSPRFSLKYTEKQTIALLVTAYKMIVEARNKDFKFDKETQENIYAVSKWLCNAKSSIGLFLCGKVGIGKTNMIKAIGAIIDLVCSDEKGSNDSTLHIVSAVKICEYARNNYEQYKKIKECKLLAIDDLGVEPTEIKDFGNVFYPITDIIDYRYQEQKFTIITTNMPPDEIKSRYGLRTSDRFSEMFTRVWFKNEKSYR